MTTIHSTNRHDPWLSVFCPEESCLTEAESVAIPSDRPHQGDRKSVWLAVFCPENQCEAETPTHVA